MQTNNDFFNSDEFDALIASTKTFWDECDYMGNPGAKEEYILILKERLQIDLPADYICFLRKLNGFKYNDYVLFNCNTVKYDGRLLLIGYSHKEHITFEHENRKYYLIDKTLNISDFINKNSTSVTKQFDTFADMFRNIMCEALPQEKLSKIYSLIVKNLS